MFIITSYLLGLMVVRRPLVVGLGEKVFLVVVALPFVFAASLTNKCYINTANKETINRLSSR